MNSSNRHLFLRLLPLDQVTSPQDLRTASSSVDPDPFEVEGPERLFRMQNAFRAENLKGAAGLVAQALIWAHARLLDAAQFQQFRENIGFNQPPGFDLREELLDAMADRIGALYNELGSAFPVWAVLLLTSRPQRGGITTLLAEVTKCPAEATATDILACFAMEAERRDAEERYE
jgi:hypothetical protein